MELESLTFIWPVTSPVCEIFEKSRNTLMMDKLSRAPKRQRDAAVAACPSNVAWRRSLFFNVGNP